MEETKQQIMQKEKEIIPKKLTPLDSSPKMNKIKQQQKQKQQNEQNRGLNKQVENLQNKNSMQISSQLMKNKQPKFVLDQYDQKAIILCQFCGGQACPQQNYLVNKMQPNAIEGLHSNWITDQILATQRPSDKLIKKFNLIQAFKKYKLNTILNLQQPGQHPYCGDGIDLYNGFSYNPQTFFQNGIRFENQCWEDMTATTFQHMMKIMNIFHRSINQNKGKIAVHCHAGRGRTLLVICSWLIYFDGMPAQKTIQLAVLKRQGVLTRSSQRQFLKQFQKQLHKRRKVFHHIEHKTSFSQFFEWQKGCWLSYQKKQSRQRPYVHYKIVDMLRKRVQKQGEYILKAFISLNGPKKMWTKKQQQRVVELKKQFDNGRPNIKKDEQLTVLVTLIQDFYDHLPFTVFSLHSVQLLKDELAHQQDLVKKQSRRAVTKIKNVNDNILKNDINNKEINQLGMESKIVQRNQNQSSNYGSSGTEGFKRSNKDSDLSWFPIKLKVLYEPSTVHELGVSGIASFLDLMLLAKQILSICSDKLTKQEIKALFIKFSIIFQSKKQFFPRLFRGDNLRDSRLVQKMDKIQKYTNKNIAYLAQYMQNIYRHIPDDEQFFQKMIIKLKKVQGNIQHYKVQHYNSRSFHDIDKLKKIYDDARIQ